LCIMCRENSVPLSRDWGGSLVRGLVIPQSALLDVTMCGLWMHAGPVHPDAYLDICPRHLPPVRNNYPGFLPYDKCPPPERLRSRPHPRCAFIKCFFLKRKFNSQRQTRHFSHEIWPSLICNSSGYRKQIKLQRRWPRGGEAVTSGEHLYSGKCLTSYFSFGKMSVRRWVSKQGK